MIKTYDVALSNRSTIFDEANGFESTQAVIEWAAGRGGSYVIQIGTSDPYDCPISIDADCKDGTTLYSYYDTCKWVPVTVDDIARMI